MEMSIPFLTAIQKPCDWSVSIIMSYDWSVGIILSTDWSVSIILGCCWSVSIILSCSLILDINWCTLQCTDPVMSHLELVSIEAELCGEGGDSLVLLAQRV